MGKEDRGLVILTGVFIFLCVALVCLLIPMMLSTQMNTVSETFNESCTIIAGDKMYEDCLIIERDKENGVLEFKCDGKDIYVYGQYTIIKEDE